MSENIEQPAVESENIETDTPVEHVETVNEVQPSTSVLCSTGLNSNPWSTWNSWLSTAKNKSTEVLGFVKKDLEELGSAVKTEATLVVNNTANVLEKTLRLDDNESTASTMKRSFSSFLGQMNQVLNPPPNDTCTEAIIVSDNAEIVSLTKLQKELLELQSEVNTYLNDPEEHSQYQCWLEIINDQLTEDKLTKQLLAHDMLNQKYLELCPNKVSHDLFWKRYLFKKALLEDRLADEESKLKRLHKENVDERASKPFDIVDAVIPSDVPGWKAPIVDFDASTFELSEAQQIKLLEDYENEQRMLKSSELEDETAIFEKNDKLLAAVITKGDGTAVSSGSSMDSEWEKV